MLNLVGDSWMKNDIYIFLKCVRCFMKRKNCGFIVEKFGRYDFKWLRVNMISSGIKRYYGFFVKCVYV